MKTTLSNKKQTELYSSVHNRCMDARIEVITLLKKKGIDYEDIDLVFYKLCAAAPKLALRCFEKKV